MLSVDVLSLADVLDGQIFFCDQPEKIKINGASIDTRALPESSVFFAFKGESVDGHDYIQSAQSSGASVAVVERVDEACDLPQIKVDDVKSALGRTAYWWRDKIDAKVIAITGSNGKTTVKEMLFSIFSKMGNTVATKGNLNNELGMPLTLLRVSKDTEYAVLEMGANHFGEIDYMSSIARPDIALVNNAGPAHLLGFGDVLGVAKAKGEIYNGLNKNGTAIINADDEKSDIWRSQCADKKMLSFAINTGADVQGEWSSETQVLTLFSGSKRNQTSQIKLNLLGQHNALNALAAATVAMAVGVDVEAIKIGLESLHAFSGRLKPTQCRNNLLVIDDTYNANPASLMAGVKVALEKQGAQVWLAIGDLGELGSDEQIIHAQLGKKFLDAGVARLFTYGELSQYAALEFGEQGFSFSQRDDLIKTLIDEIDSSLKKYAHPISILVKGSRSTKMECVVNALTDAFGV